MKKSAHTTVPCFLLFAIIADTTCRLPLIFEYFAGHSLRRHFRETSPYDAASRGMPLLRCCFASRLMPTARRVISRAAAAHTARDYYAYAASRQDDE